jgi:hypothetical protein
MSKLTRGEFLGLGSILAAAALECGRSDLDLMEGGAS